MIELSGGFGIEKGESSRFYGALILLINMGVISTPFQNVSKELRFSELNVLVRSGQSELHNSDA